MARAGRREQVVVGWRVGKLAGRQASDGPGALDRETAVSNKSKL